MHGEYWPAHVYFRDCMYMSASESVCVCALGISQRRNYVRSMNSLTAKYAASGACRHMILIINKQKKGTQFVRAKQ